MFIKYCKNCVMPDTKWENRLDENGICSACRFVNVKEETDWEKRREKLKQIFDKYKSKDGSNYDCICPVSGGKDSHYITYIVTQVFGLNPLLVSFRPTHRELTDIGRKNLENLKKRFNVDCLEFTPNAEVYKKIQKIGLLELGDASYPAHFSIFTIPTRVAVEKKIPLIVWGENSQAEYGGPKGDSEKLYLDQEWLKRYGLTAKSSEYSDYNGPEFLRKHGIKEHELLPYIYPSEKELQNVGVTGIFLGQFVKWDVFKQVELMKKYGFSVIDGKSEGTYTNFENLDNKDQGLHDYLKWLKFGYGRTSDHVSMEIRKNRITRAEGIELVKKFEGKIPNQYLHEYLKDFEMTRDEFLKAVDKFINKDLFKKDENGNLVRDSEGNLEKINYDNLD